MYQEYSWQVFNFQLNIKTDPLAEEELVETNTSTESPGLPPNEVVTQTTDFVVDLIDSTTLVEDTTSNTQLPTTDESMVMSGNDCSQCLEPKYLKHYYAKGCKPVLDENCNNCPKKFDCSEKVNIVVGSDGKSKKSNDQAHIYHIFKYSRVLLQWKQVQSWRKGSGWQPVQNMSVRVWLQSRIHSTV